MYDFFFFCIMCHVMCRILLIDRHISNIKCVLVKKKGEMSKFISIYYTLFSCRAISRDVNSICHHVFEFVVLDKTRTLASKSHIGTVLPDGSSSQYGCVKCTAMQRNVKSNFDRLTFLNGIDEARFIRM